MNLHFLQGSYNKFFFCTFKKNFLILGEEALKRLLSCRGQDAYSILGLRLDCTDEEVKCYYRRQAILVHPDKVILIFFKNFVITVNLQ